MKVLVTGATGFVGSKLVQQLLKEQYKVNVLSRSIQKAISRLGSSVQVFEWDYKKDEFPIQSFDGVDAVIHLAGESVFSRWNAEQKKEILSSRVESTEKILKALGLHQKQATHKVSIFISASAIGYYGDRKNEVLTESSEKGLGFLSDVCEQWESAVLNNSSTQSIRKVCVRTGVVLSRDGGALQQMLSIFKKGLGGKIGSGIQWISWIHIEDLVKIFLFLLNNKSMKGIVNAVAPNPVRNSALTKRLSTILKKPAFFSVPEFMLKILLGEAAEVVLSSQRVLPQKLSEAGYRFNFEKLDSALKNEI